MAERHAGLLVSPGLFLWEARCICGWWSRRIFKKRARRDMNLHLFDMPGAIIPHDVDSLQCLYRGDTPSFMHNKSCPRCELIAKYLPELMKRRGPLNV